MTERIAAWQCIGCGRIEVPRPCVGVCEDRKADLVHAADYDAALARLAVARRQRDELAELARQIVHVTPREGQCARAWLALQSRARRLLETVADEE